MIDARRPLPDRTLCDQLSHQRTRSAAHAGGRAARGVPVIVADPLFGERAAEPSSMYFTPLSNTAAEAREIKKLFPEARLLTGAHATKTALATLDAPRLLHIASHGFFFRGDAADAARARQATRAMNASVSTENPLLRSGLALAGANLEDAALLATAES